MLLRNKRKFIVAFTGALLASLARGGEGVDDLLSDHDRVSTVRFSQSASGGTDASTIAKITLSYFTSSNCTGSKQGTGAYTTPDGTSFSIGIGSPFSLNADSTWSVGSNQLSIADMTAIQSVAVVFKSTNSVTPQSNFSGKNFACIPVTCSAGPGGQCTSVTGTTSFSLKTTTDIGDPAEGGVIGCKNTGGSANLYNLIVLATNPSTLQWGGSGTTTGSTSTSDGAGNTATIVTSLGTGISYAARACQELSVAGGYTSGWYLPAGSNSTSEQQCLYDNKTAVETGMVAAGGAAFPATHLWSSTEANSTSAYRLSFGTGAHTSALKGNAQNYRCVRSF